MSDDGVNRDSLDYKAGWLEALRVMGQMIDIERVRAENNQVLGLALAHNIVNKKYNEMLTKVRLDMSKDRPLDMNKVDEYMAKMKLDMSKGKV